MKAALLVEPGRIIVDDVADPDVGRGEVGIAVGGVGLCGSDMSVFLGRWPAPHYPWIMGHEAFGVIERVGSGIDAARLGDVVVIEPNIACQDCPECLHGRTSACRRRQSLGMNRQGALAEKIVVPARLAWTIDHPDARDLVCIEPLAIVETALHRLSTPLPGTALVIGAGPQGLLMSLALLRRGVDVQVTDLNADRVTFTSEILGARALDPGKDDLFELIVDTTGAPDAVAEAVRRSAVGALILELGLEKRPFELSAETLVRRQLVLRGSLTYDHPHDFRRVISLVESGEVSPGCVISDEYPLPEAQRAFESSQTARGKTWIRPRELV